MCAYQGVRIVSFSENIAHLLNGWPQRDSTKHWTFETAEVNNSEAATGVVLWKKGVFKGKIHCDILLSEYYMK